MRSGEAERPRRSLLHDTLLVTLSTFGAQLLALASQVVFAALFGASAGTDAYFAALALPAYVYLVLMSSLGVVLVPAYIDRRANGGSADAWTLASGATNLSLLVLGAFAVAGMVVPGALLDISAPGLSPEAHAVAARLAVVLWPSILGSGAIAVLTELWQAESRFRWPAAVPLIGAALNLGLIVVLGRAIGIDGVAIAWTASVLVQAALLVPLLVGRWRPTLALGHPAMRAMLVAISPLLASNVVVRLFTVVERFLASGLPSGELSQIAYASRIVTTLGVFLSGGLAAAIFPRLAEHAAARDVVRLRESTARGARALWIVIAPTVTLLVALAGPGVALVLERGAFTSGDSSAVAALLRVDALSLIGLALAPLAGRALYALRATRFLAVAGTLDTLSYAAYAAVLAAQLGAIGLALAFTIHNTVALVAYAAYLWWSTGRPSVLGGSVATTTALAALAGVAAWAVAGAFGWALASTIAGASVGAAVYVVGLAVTRPSELSALAPIAARIGALVPR